VKSGHSREGGNPELFNIPGFRVALRLPGTRDGKTAFYKDLKPFFTCLPKSSM